MFCSSCGAAIAPGLSFCNRCGAELNKKKSGSGGSEIPESLIWAIVAVSVGGLALVIGLMAVMKNELHFDNQLILLISLLSFLPLLAADFVFIWLLIKSSRRVERREKESQVLGELKGATTRELGEARERFLDAPALSVTEEATRTFEAVKRGRED